MLDVEALRKIRLHRRPFAQRSFAWMVLSWDYALPRRTQIVLEGTENLPDRPVFLAMNHTDRYNYWPFQYRMFMDKLPRMTATWVKGKYYEHPFMAWFMNAMNNIPLPSRGYVIATRFREASGAEPNEGEYRFLRDLVDGRVDAKDLDLEAQSEAVRTFVQGYGGTEGQAGCELAAQRLEQEFEAMMGEVARLNYHAMFECDLNVLVFPQGTRSKRLSKGHIGLAQMAQHLGATIVPVGCNGSDRVYPGNSPMAKGGSITYRIGKPLEPHGDTLREFRVTAPFTPFTKAAAKAHGEKFRAITSVVMNAINDLVDEEYRFSDDANSDGVAGTKRFL